MNIETASTSETEGMRVHPNHAVQFYETEEFLCKTVGDFLSGGLTAKQPLVVIATPDRWQGVSTHLRSQPSEVDTWRKSGWLTVLDARETLSKIIVEDMPDVDRFMTLVGGVVERSAKLARQAGVRAYGEMVDLLWHDGNPEAAIRLEELWNELANTHDLSLLCAYGMGNFRRHGDARGFLDVCRQHAHVHPETQDTLAESGARSPEIGRLQQRARALEVEVEYRKRLEGALRNALVERRRFEEALLDSEGELRNLLAEREDLLRSERAARAQAEEASRLKDEFLAIISHELRTPLNAIFGWAHIGTDQKTDEAMVRRALEVILRNARLQLRVVDDLLDISRIISGKMKISSEIVDLVVVLAAAADSLRPDAAAKSIELVVRIQDAPLFTRGDAGRLQQVIWNLLSNAIKFTPAGGRVTLSLAPQGDVARMVVSDTGVGIEPEFLPLVFDRFRQADATTTRRHGGLGLGLAVVRHLVDAHAGHVGVESSGVGQGATFTVTLPLSKEGSRDSV